MISRYFYRLESLTSKDGVHESKELSLKSSQSNGDGSDIRSKSSNLSGSQTSESVATDCYNAGGCGGDGVLDVGQVGLNLCNGGGGECAAAGNEGV